MTSRTALPQALAETRLMAILRAPDAWSVEPVAHALASAGVRCLEVTLTGTGALEVVRALRKALPADVLVGAGSVLTGDQARAALDVGAEFLVAPATDPEVIELALLAGVGVYPGAWTATEVLRAWQLGATAVKVFPCSSGGPQHLSQLAAPLPHIPLIAVGGVTPANAADYLAAGAVALGIGSALTRDADDGGLADRVARLLETTRQSGEATA